MKGTSRLAALRRTVYCRRDHIGKHELDGKCNRNAGNENGVNVESEYFKGNLGK
jgi:hypothetical protein